ncbi:hypothetical protein EV424DRAFT_1343810 [Suillus variegatus]|nr:hypothetical protein EV424DRAFT_1343810 [Suillus variegatus]
MTISGNLKTGTYTLRNASTNDFVVVQGPKTAALVTSNDGRAENAAWVLEKLSGHYDKYNIRNFAQNSYATVNTGQKRSAALTCGRETHMYFIQDITALRCFAVLEPENVRGSLTGSTYMAVDIGAVDGRSDQHRPLVLASPLSLFRISGSTRGDYLMEAASLSDVKDGEGIECYSQGIIKIQWAHGDKRGFNSETKVKEFRLHTTPVNFVSGAPHERSALF